MAKPNKKNFFMFRIGTAVVAVAVCAALGVSISTSLAQTWSEPSASPPAGNVAAPIWNQNTAAQTGNFWVSGNGYVGGKVGIGTSSPGSTLTVSRPIITAVDNGAAADSTVLIRQNTDGVGAAALEFGFGAATNYLGSRIVSNIVGGGGADLLFQTGTGSAGTYTTKMDIQRDGNVGIGTSSPTALVSILRSTSGTGFDIEAPLGSTFAGWRDNATHQYYAAQNLAASTGDFQIYVNSNGGGGWIESMHVKRSNGYIGLGSNPTPNYPLDVNGTVNAAGGAGTAVLATSTGAYGVYGTGVTAGAAGISTAGYGVYGSSSGSYAGYFNGTLNATGNITQNGVAVCLANGTNCQAQTGGGGSTQPDLQFTRTTIATNASLATKDAQCVTEFGTNYRTASLGDATAYFHGMPYTATYTDGSNYRNATVSSFGLTSSTNGVLKTSDGVTDYYVNGSGGGSGSTNGIGIQETVYSAGPSTPYPVTCVRKDAPLLFTRGAVAVNSTIATKDAQCASELGTSYRTASLAKITSYIDENVTPFAGSDNGANTWYDAQTATLGLDNTTNARIQGTNGIPSNMTGGSGNTGLPTNQKPGVQEVVYTTSLTATFGVACERVGTVAANNIYWTLNGTSLTPSDSTYVIKQNGVEVCLEDGTNCPSSSNSLQFTRTTVAYNATLATKDAQCVTEFGANYQTADLATAAANYQGRLYGYTPATCNNASGDQFPITFGLSSVTNGAIQYDANCTQSPASGSTFYVMNEGLKSVTLASGSASVACVKKSASLLTTRGTVAYNAALATKDAQCTTEYGANYQTADLPSASANFTGKLYGMGNQYCNNTSGTLYPVRVGLGTVANNSIDYAASCVMSQGSSTAAQGIVTEGLTNTTLSSGSVIVLCKKKN